MRAGDREGRGGAGLADLGGLNGLSGAAGGKSVAQDEVDEIEVYGSEAQSGTQLATYSFEVSACGAGPRPGRSAHLTTSVPSGM